MRTSVLHVLLTVSGLIAALGTTRCGGSGGGTTSTSTGTCGNFCGTGSAGGDTSATTTGSGGGAGGSGGTGSSMTTSTSSGPCTESWLCTPWDTGGNGDAATRTCKDTHNCGTSNGKPAESATLPALDDGYFKCNVEPILDRDCSMVGCHGTETGRALRVYSRGRLRHAGETISDPALCAGSGSLGGCTGSVSCPCTGKHSPVEWQRNYDAARGFALDAAGQPIPAGMEATSDLIQQPVVGGKAHTGIHLFTMSDPEFNTLKTWLGSAGKSTPCNTQFN
jgi:hypothetical protein